MSQQKTYTLEDLKQMPVAEVQRILNTRGATFSGVALVRDKDGNPKYDNPALAGSYGEK